MHVTIVSTRTVAIQPRALSCELQPVPIEEIDTITEPEPSKDVLDKVNLGTKDFGGKRHVGITQVNFLNWRH